jgi:hypothetical protein
LFANLMQGCTKYGVPANDLGESLLERGHLEWATQPTRNELVIGSVVGVALRELV